LTCTLPSAAHRPRIALCTLLIAVAALAGCANQSTVRGGWQEGAARGQAFSRVLIVGVSPDANQRCDFEYFMASQIKSEATTPLASCSVLSVQEPLTRAAVERAVAAQKADAVLTTTLVAMKSEFQEGGTRETRGDAGFKATGTGYATTYAGAYGVPVVYGEMQNLEPLSTARAAATVETKLYETKGATVVYSMESRASKVENRAEGLAAITVPIAKQLRRDGLIR
jgi:hypothetical protein